tara:strand:- start:522 stop:758 length:237 start_codon:yes stop_codon:yes gene_type:complete
MKIEWVIWGKGYSNDDLLIKGEVINTIRECVKPAMTKEYRELKHRFDVVGDIRAFGFTTLEELRKENNWLTPDTKATM